MFESVNSVEPLEAEDKPKARRGLFRAEPVEPVNIPNDPRSVKDQFYVVQKGDKRKYYSDYHQKHLAITATDKVIRTHLSDPKTVSAVVDLAKARGWESIRAKGTDEFKAEVWIEGSLRGMKVEGYAPNETNKQELARRQAQQSAQSAPTTQAVPVQAAKPQAKASEDMWAAKAANGAAIAKKSGRVRTQTNGINEHLHA